MVDQTNLSACDTLKQPLLSAKEALDYLLNAAPRLNRKQTVSLDDSLYCILAKDVRSEINVPEFNNSAMDGYAISLKDNQINKPGLLRFKITDRITAGSSGKSLEPGCAARIFTGAPVPDGANTVIMQEECDLTEDGNYIETWKPLQLNENIRPKGNDIQAGDIILTKGTQLKPQDIALCASIGIPSLEVFEKLKVGVFFTGNELVEPGHPLNTGQIYNSNRYSLIALLKQLNCEIVNLGNIEDSLDATTQALSQLANTCDIVITTGGVSVGEEDHVKPAVEQLGELTLWRIKMKPGKPLAFGRIKQSFFIGLPGNPVSAMVTFCLFARPFIKKMQGASTFKNQSTDIQCDFDWPRPKPRREFVRVQINQDTTPPTAKLYPKQGSDVLSSLTWADGLVEIPDNETFKPGDILKYFSLLELTQ